VPQVKELTDGRGAEAVIDFVGEGGAIEDGLALLRRAGSYYIIGYGGTLAVPTIDIIASEVSFVGNLVGTYNDLVELMTLAAQAIVVLHTATYSLEAVNDAISDLESGRLHGRGILIP
jgi:NAD+-dependent secondary alcohol dehydrogenase Adh1